MTSTSITKQDVTHKNIHTNFMVWSFCDDVDIFVHDTTKSKLQSHVVISRTELRGLIK